MAKSKEEPTYAEDSLSLYCYKTQASCNLSLTEIQRSSRPPVMKPTMLLKGVKQQLMMIMMFQTPSSSQPTITGPGDPTYVGALTTNYS